MNNLLMWLMMFGKTAQEAAAEVCRYFFTFNNDGYITTSRRWNPDAANPAWGVRFRGDLSLMGTIISQSTSTAQSSREFQIYMYKTNELHVVMGGTEHSTDISDFKRISSLWEINFNGVDTITIKKDKALVITRAGSIGAAREPTAIARIAARGNGTADSGGGYFRIGELSDVEWYVNGDCDTGDLVLDMPINDNGNTIIDYSGTANGVLIPGTGGWAEKCGLSRYIFTFVGDDYITTARRWNPDAANPSFVFEFWNNISSIAEGRFLSQSVHATSTSRELQFISIGDGTFRVTLGGINYEILNDNTFALWRVEFDAPTEVIRIYKNNVFQVNVNDVVIGAAREPAQPMVIMARSDGALADIGRTYDVKFYVNGSTKETADLVLDMPINDNSDTIIDYSGTANGVLTSVNGAWINEVQYE